MEMVKKLKPCPFCGGEAKLWQFRNWDADCFETWVRCKGCGIIVAGKDTPLTYVGEETGKISATARWNTRANPTQEPTTSKEKGDNK